MSEGVPNLFPILQGHCASSASLLGRCSQWCSFFTTSKCRSSSMNWCQTIITGRREVFVDVLSSVPTWPVFFNCNETRTVHHPAWPFAQPVLPSEMAVMSQSFIGIFCSHIFIKKNILLSTFTSQFPKTRIDLYTELGFGTFLVPAVSVFGTWKRVIRFPYFGTFLKWLIRYLRQFQCRFSVPYFGILKHKCKKV